MTHNNHPSASRKIDAQQFSDRLTRDLEVALHWIDAKQLALILSKHAISLLETHFSAIEGP